jgi:hypothetical protein
VVCFCWISTKHLQLAGKQTNRDRILLSKRPKKRRIIEIRNNACGCWDSE